MMVMLAALAAAAAVWCAVRAPVWSRRSPSALPRLLQFLRGRLSRRRRTRERAAVRESFAEVVADMRAGQPPMRALARAFTDQGHSCAPRTSAAARCGGDVVEALRMDAHATGQPLLLSASACWSVAAAHGAGLADSLDRIVQQDRRAEDVRRQLEAHLAAPRATARMLALLPALGLGLGMAVGGDPLAWLLGTPWGWGCLVVGLSLTGLGLAWAKRIVAGTERLL